MVIGDVGVHSFVENSGLRSHMLSKHAKEGNEMENCAADFNRGKIRDLTADKRMMGVTADLMSEKADH